MTSDTKRQVEGAMGTDGKGRKPCFSCDLKYSRCGPGEPEGGAEGGMKEEPCMQVWEN